MADEKRRESAGRVASAIALPEWSLRRKLALALALPMLLAATFGGLRVHTELAQSGNYSATAKQIEVLRPAAGFLAAAERAIIISRQRPSLQDPGRVSAISAVDVAGKRLQAVGTQADLTSDQLTKLDTVVNLSQQLRNGDAYVSSGQAVSQVRQLQRGVTELIDSIVAAQIEPEPKLAALQQALDGRVSLAMQQYQVNVSNPAKQVNTVDLAAEMGVEQVIIDRLGSYLGTSDKDVVALNQQNAAHFGVIRSGGYNIGDAEQFEPYDDLTGHLLDDIDKNLTSAASDARGLAIANAVITLALLLAALLLALLVSRLLLNPIRRVREGALEIANTRLPEMVARIRAGEDPGDITPIAVHTHEEMGQLARSVDDLQRQALTLAAGETKLRSQVGEMFSTLSRRNTSLINQQLGLIERLEKDEEDPARLESLFRLDHLASRMRRTSESLMVLADAPSTASDQDTLALGDVFQAAMAGVQEYQRVQVEGSSPEKVNGTAAADVVHLMTELVDNALAYSPPTAPVRISTRQAGDSTVVEISDGGLGIAQDVLDSLNEDLSAGGEVTPETARRMGLLVVSRIAKRHGITVVLSRNTRGGTTATVLLPPTLLGGGPAPTQPKQRPGLGSLSTAKPVRPAAVAEEPAPAATLAPSPAAPSTPAPAGPREVEVDSIAAAINAVTRLPQRAPGATRTGSAMPGAPVGSTGGSLFQRLRASEAAQPPKPELPKREPASPTAAFGAIDAALAKPEPQPEPQREPQRVPQPEPKSETKPETKPEEGALDLAPVSVEQLAADGEQDATSTLGELVTPPDPVSAPTGLPRRSGLSNFHALNGGRATSEPPADVPAPAPATWVPAPSAAPAAPPAQTAVYDMLDPRSPIPESAEDETPIFLTLRSRWLSTGSGATWTSSEIEAGWDAAEQVAEAAPVQVSRSGLPMRRPGSRLVPGGVSPTPVSVSRDPEAIRARLAAHAAGVSRGRSAAVDESATAPRTTLEEGPA